MTFGSMKAQDNPFKPEWFVSGGINGLSALNGFGKQHAGRQSIRRSVAKQDYRVCVSTQRPVTCG